MGYLRFRNFKTYLNLMETVGKSMPKMGMSTSTSHFVPENSHKWAFSWEPFAFWKAKNFFPKNKIFLKEFWKISFCKKSNLSIFSDIFWRIWKKISLKIILKSFLRIKEVEGRNFKNKNNQPQEWPCKQTSWTASGNRSGLSGGRLNSPSCFNCGKVKNRHQRKKKAFQSPQIFKFKRKKSFLKQKKYLSAWAEVHHWRSSYWPRFRLWKWTS